MRIVFMGTPESAVPSLARLMSDGHEVVAVWTQPDRPAGRGDKIHSPPVKDFAVAHNLTVEQPGKIKTLESKTLFNSYVADVAVVVAYGRILPSEYLTAPRHGCINVHFSLLPKYRGAAPANWAIVNGETETGVSTMFIEEELDAGPVLLQRPTSIGAKETTPELMGRLAEMGAELLSETLSRLGTIDPQPQDNKLATFAPMLTREHGRIDWSKKAEEVECGVRGFQPWPNAWTTHRNKRLIVWNSEVVSRNTPATCGAVVSAHGDELLIACGESTAIRLVEVQPENKRRMSVRDFLNGTHLKVGERFGEV